MKTLYKLKHKETGKYWSGSGSYKTLTNYGRIFKRKPTPKDFGSFPHNGNKKTKAKDFALEKYEIKEVLVTSEEWR